MASGAKLCRAAVRRRATATMSMERTDQASWDPSSSDSESDDDGVSNGEQNLNREPDEDAAWAAQQQVNASGDSDSEEDDMPWNNFRRTHRLTEIARWKKVQGLEPDLLQSIREYCSKIVSSDEAHINDPIDITREELRQVGLDIFCLSDGYCVSSTSFDEAQKYCAQKKKEAQERENAHNEGESDASTDNGDIDEGDEDSIGRVLSGSMTPDGFDAPVQVAARTSSSLADQLRLAQKRKKPIASAYPPTPSGNLSFTATASGSSSSEEEEEQQQQRQQQQQSTESKVSGGAAKSADAAGAAASLLTAEAHKQFCSHKVGTTWAFALSNWGEDRCMQAFDELIQKGWTMQVYKTSGGAENAGLPSPGDSLDVSLTASWWQDGAHAVVHNNTPHVQITIGQRKCLPSVEEALTHVPVGASAEIVISPDYGAAFSALGPDSIAKAAEVGDHLVCRVQVHSKAQ